MHWYTQRLIKRAPRLQDGAVDATTIAALAKEHGVPGDEVIKAMGGDPEEGKRRARETNERIRKAADELERERVFREIRERRDVTPQERLEKAEAAIEQAADVIRKSDPTLTREQAVEKALEIEPDLYTRACEARQEVENYTIIAKAAESRQLRRDDAHAKAEREATRIRKSDPSLSAEAAYARALEENPDLYVR